MTRWAMVIDLDKCVACQGCSIACRFENNTPPVKPSEALKGRAVRWNDVFPLPINPTEETSSIELVYHYYIQTEARDSLADTGIDADPDGRNKSLGSEIDLVLGYEDEENGFAAALALGYFIPGKAFPRDAGNSFITNLTLEYRF